MLYTYSVLWYTKLYLQFHRAKGQRSHLQNQGSVAFSFCPGAEKVQ